VFGLPIRAIVIKRWPADVVITDYSTSTRAASNLRTLSR
jgi:hypothetical protein